MRLEAAEQSVEDVQQVLDRGVQPAAVVVQEVRYRAEEVAQEIAQPRLRRDVQVYLVEVAVTANAATMAASAARSGSLSLMDSSFDSVVGLLGRVEGSPHFQ